MNVKENRTIYKLQSLATGQLFEDSGWLLETPGTEPAGLIRANYQSRQLRVKGDEFGLYTYADWMPIQRILRGSSPPVTYKSEKLASRLGLSQLFITFSGYWPEKGAFMRSCSFKETEAYSVCGRLDTGCEKVLVVASAGNTARSFARVCSDNRIGLLLCVPEDNLDALWFDQPLGDCVKLAATRSGSDYFDAIHLSNLACQINGFIPEGGAKNIARRDGMGTTVLSATLAIGRIPDYYFQAVGSGTGAIAAWEANLRLLDDGRFGNHKMKLMLSQNEPFHPIYDAWTAGSRELFPMDEEVARKKVEKILAKVLSNRKPPYSLPGGLFDAMTDTKGEMFLVKNRECREAASLFEKLEGIDIHPAAAVAVASLMDAARDGKVDKDAVIMLNITGGGEERFKKGHELFYLKPHVVFGMCPPANEVKEKLERLF
ncbi:MAG: cysteate synthase [Bacteroidetes bacterium]|nr:cysteate synthase [Bacteroidota bacterium]